MSLPPRDPTADQHAQGPLIDPFGRRHTYVRVSVTDRCNYRCTYCMPAEGLNFLPREDLLTFEEITRVVTVLAGMGVFKVRLTGGEPTVRRGLPELVRMLADIPGITDLAMTTNAHGLAPMARPLAAAGLRRVNISIDSLDPELFRTITRGGDVARVLAGIDAALEAGLAPVKLNCVVLRGVNDHEVEGLVDHFAGRNVVVRFIEYMPFDRTDRAKHHVPSAELRARFAGPGPLVAVPRLHGAGPSTDWRIASGSVVGFISPMTEHFCQACNRLRLQADGHLRTCLSREALPSLRDMLRRGLDDAGLAATLRDRVWGKIAGHEADLEGDAYVPFEGVMTEIGG